MLDMLEMHEDKYLVRFLMKYGFNGVQRKQHENNLYFLTLKVFGFLILFIFPPCLYLYIG